MTAWLETPSLAGTLPPLIGSVGSVGTPVVSFFSLGLNSGMRSPLDMSGGVV
jgi:hypothetical protein